MSADNYNVIASTEDGRIGLWLNLCASHDYPDGYGEPDRTFDVLENAIRAANAAGYTEYGTSITDSVLTPEEGK